MAKRYFVSSYLLLQCLAVIGSENNSNLRQSNDNLRCSQEIPKLEKKASKQEIGIEIAYYCAGFCGNRKYDRLTELKPLPSYEYHSDCP